MSRSGRPISLDERRRGAIGELLAAGVPIKTTAIACGIGERTLHRWLARGLVARPEPAPPRMIPYVRRGRADVGEELSPISAEAPVPQSVDELLEELREPLELRF